MIEIEKGIPAPAKETIRRKYPFHMMEIGDSFFVPGRERTQMCSSIANAKKTTGFLFTSHSVNGGVRVWRIA